MLFASIHWKTVKKRIKCTFELWNVMLIAFILYYVNWNYKSLNVTEYDFQKPFDFWFLSEEQNKKLKNIFSNYCCVLVPNAYSALDYKIEVVTFLSILLLVLCWQASCYWSIALPLCELVDTLSDFTTIKQGERNHKNCFSFHFHCWNALLTHANFVETFFFVLLHYEQLIKRFMLFLLMFTFNPY